MNIKILTILLLIAQGCQAETTPPCSDADAKNVVLKSTYYDPSFKGMVELDSIRELSYNPENKTRKCEATLIPSQEVINHCNKYGLSCGDYPFRMKYNIFYNELKEGYFVETHKQQSEDIQFFFLLVRAF